MRADAWFTGRARSYSGALGAVGSRRLIRTAPGSERRRAVRMSGRTSTAIRRGSGLPTRWRLARSPVLRGLTPGCLHRFREVVLKSADDHVEWIEPSPIAEGRSHHVNLSLYLAICDRDTLQHGALVICDRDVGDWVHDFPLSRLNFSRCAGFPGAGAERRLGKLQSPPFVGLKERAHEVEVRRHPSPSIPLARPPRGEVHYRRSVRAVTARGC